MNVIILMGHLTADPELKQTTNNLSVCSFTVAVDRNLSKEKTADFIPVVAWRHTADFVTKYFRKGDMIAIEGELQTRKYQDKNGNNRTAYEVLAHRVNFCGKKEASTEVVSENAEQFTEVYATDEQLPF